MDCLETENLVAAKDRLNRISREGMCTGCGLCEGIAGRESIRMLTSPSGYERPHVVGDLTQETVDIIYDSCPGLRQDSLPEALLDEDAIIDPVWGPYLEMMSAHATDQEVRIKAASGGVLTALSMYLVDTGQVSFVLHATPASEDVTFGVPKISLSSEDVRQGTSSIYGPTAPLKDIKSVLDRGEPFAFVGKPCDISALRNYARYDCRINTLIRYWLTPVCGGIVPPPQLDKFLATRNITRRDLTSFRYRGDMCPGDTEFETRDGAAHKANMYELYGGFDEADWQLPFRCKICPDGPGEGADIAAGDQWVDDIPDWETAHLDKGTNAVIVRTAAGARLMRAAMDAGYITKEQEITPRFYDTCQHHHVVKKMYMRARWDGLASEGRLTPRSRGLRLDEFAVKNDATTNTRQTEGTRHRVRSGNASEPAPVTNQDTP